MAKKIIWSYEAARDLEDIAGYILRDSDFYAVSLVQEIVNKTSLLKELPERG